MEVPNLGYIALTEPFSVKRDIFGTQRSYSEGIRLKS